MNISDLFPGGQGYCHLLRLQKINGLLLFVIFAIFVCQSVSAQISIVRGNSVLEFEALPKRLPLGQYAHVAEVPGSYLPDWFESPANFFDKYLAGFPGLTSLAVLSPVDNGPGAWRRNTADKLLLDSSSRLSWIVVDLLYTGASETEFVLEMAGIDGVAWRYRDHLGNWVSHGDNFSQPLGGRPLVHVKTAMPITMAPEHRYRLHIAAYTVPDGKYAAFNLWNEEAFRSQQLGQRLVDGAFFGLVLALALYNLFHFLAVRKSTHLYFALFVLASAGMIYIGSGISLVFGLKNTFPQALPLAYFFQGLVGVFGGLFTLSLLSIRGNNLILYRLWLGVITVNIGATGLIMYLGREGGFSTREVGATFNIALLLWILNQSANLYTLIHYWRRSPIARFWFLGVTLHTWALAAWMIVLNSSINPVIAPYHFAQFSTLFITVMLSALIAYNFRSEQSSRFKAQRKTVEALRLAHDLEQAKINFVASLSHDLRSPLQAIRHFTESLRPAVPEAEQSRLDHIDSNTDQVSDLVEAMANLSQLDWRATNPELRAISLAKLMIELKSEFRGRALAKDLQLTIDTTELKVLSDRICLSQILRNLIDNAIKYTEQGEVRVQIEALSDKVKISVVDTGMGIPDSEQDKIFQEFYRANADKAEGVGLGLSIVERLTRLLDIRLDYSGTEGQGSCFTLTLDKAVAGDADAAAGSSEEQSTGVAHFGAAVGISLRGLTVLAVPAHDKEVNTLLEMLLAWGAEVTQWPSLETALKNSRKTAFAPDLFITDSRNYVKLLARKQDRVVAQFLEQSGHVLLSGHDGEPEHTLRVFEDNHVLVEAGIKPMRFRALVQGLVRVSSEISVATNSR